MYKWYITITISFLMTTASAQDLANKGYIVLNSGDTLFGQVQRLKETFSGVEFLKKIRFWDENGKRKKYDLSKLSGFRVGEDTYRKYRIEPLREINILINHYQVVPYGGEATFLRVLKEGALSLYEYEWIDGMDDYISRFPLLRRSSESIMVRATQGIFGLKKKVLIAYFSDCPGLQDEIKAGTFQHPFEVVNYYNTQCN